MLTNSNPKIASLLLSLSSILLNFSCAAKSSSTSNTSSQVSYVGFAETSKHYIEFPTTGTYSDTDFDLVFEIGIFNDSLNNWQYWDRNSTVINVGWNLLCSDPDEEEFLISTGTLEFNQNQGIYHSIETRELRFSRALIEGGKCRGRQVSVQMGGPGLLAVTAPEYLPIAYFNPRDKIEIKGRYPEGILRRIQSQLPLKTLEIAKFHSAMFKASGTQRDIYCTIQSYTDPLLEGSALELTKIFENQFGPIENQSIDCSTPLEIRKKMNECQSSTSDDVVFCIVYEKYVQTASWLSTSVQLLRDLERESSLSVDASQSRLESLKNIESKLTTFGI